MSHMSKDQQELVFLYDWMRIARRPNQNLRADIKMLFELICIPITDSQIKIIQKTIDPQQNKTELTKEDLIRCFLVEEELKKPKQKQIIKAFKYISNQKEDISFEQLRKYFAEEQIDSQTSQMILKQLSEYENDKGRFNYKQFTANLF